MSSPPKKKARTVNPQEYARTIQTGLRQEIMTYDTLRRYEEHYNRVEPYLSGEQRLYLQTQFARHEEVLSQRTGLGYRPTRAQIAQQKTDVERRTDEAPLATEDADPFALGEPTAAGDVYRQRTKSEEDLASNEVLDWAGLFDSLDRPPSPPPPPPPAAGGGGPIAI